jgi:hypothetical protein
MVKWIHPSYRDLVIDELALDRGLRSRFLEAANLEGIKLCVSQAGGIEGGRRLPLLVTDHDWQLLRQRCLSLIAESDSEGAVSVISILRSATVDLHGHDHDEMSTVLGACYDALKSRWDTSGVAVKQELLSELFDAGVLVDPLPVAPKLGPSWISALSVLRQDLKTSVAGSVAIDADAVEEWCLLAKLLFDNEPRFLRQVSFPKAFIGDITQLLSTIESEAESDIVPEDAEDIWAEADRMSKLVKSLGALASCVPELRERITEVQSRADSQEDALRGAYREVSPDEEPDYEPDAIPPRENTHAPFDVDALFIDL